MTEKEVIVTVWRTNQYYKPNEPVLYAFSEPVRELDGKSVFIDLGGKAEGYVPVNKDQIISGAVLRLTAVAISPEVIAKRSYKNEYYGKDVTIVSLPAHSATAGHLNSPVSAAVSMAPKTVKIDVGTSFYEMDTALGVSVQYLENGVGIEGVDLRAYVGNSSNPLMRPMNGLNSFQGEDDQFGLLTDSGGVAIDGILLKDIPKSCDRVTIVSPEGKRATAIFSKEIVKKIKAVVNQSIEKKKNPVYSLKPMSVNSGDLRVTITADDKPVAAEIVIRAVGVGAAESKFRELGSENSHSEIIELGNDSGIFDIKVEFTVGSLNLDIRCPKFGQQKFHRLWKK